MTFNNRQAGAQYRASLSRSYKRMAKASRAAMNEARDVTRKEGIADIRAGGNFGSRWIKSLNTNVEPARVQTIDLVLRVFHTISYANIFEYGGIIKGKPLLWIPLSFTKIKMRARDWANRYGGLFRVDRVGKAPLLLSIRTGKPMYFGKESVRQKRRFHMRRIVREQAKKLGTYYRKAFRNAAG
jgi:hypothetical protein